MLKRCLLVVALLTLTAAVTSDGFAQRNARRNRRSPSVPTTNQITNPTTANASVQVGKTKKPGFQGSSGDGQSIRRKQPRKRRKANQ